LPAHPEPLGYTADRFSLFGVVSNQKGVTRIC
jgi:hypothetical protein